MRRIQGALRSQRVFLLAAVLVTAFSLLFTLGTPAYAEQPPVVLNDVLAQNQVYDDLEVERGQVLTGDVAVFSGDVVVRSGGRIEGALTVYSGDIEIEEGGSVSGSITAVSGDVEVNGSVGGSISAMAGDVEVGSAASIAGGISVMAGDIKQRAGASVGGNVLRGPELALPSAPPVDWLPGMEVDQPASIERPTQPESAGSIIVDMLRRGLTALLLLGLFVGGATSVTALRPAWAAELHGVLRRQAALAFAAGLIANVLLLTVIGFLFITVCLRPPALLLALGMLGLNVAGMAAVGAEIGGRASERLSGQWPPTAQVALGVVAPGLVIVFLWTLGGCFAFFAGLGALLLGSFGLGTILVKALNLGSSSAATRTAAPAGSAPVAEGSASAETPAVVPPATVSPAAVNPAAVSPAAVNPAGNDSAPDLAPYVSVTDALAAEPTVTEAPDATSPLADAPAADAPAAEEASSAPAPWWQETAVEESVAAQQTDPPVVTEAPSPAGDLAVEPVDFTVIEGIGPKLSQRLHAANIRTYADLAGLPPETLAGILGWSSERVLRSNILDRARRLATE